MNAPLVHLVRPLPVDGVTVVLCRTLGARAVLGRTARDHRSVTCRACLAIHAEPNRTARLAALAADLRHAVEVARVYGIWSDETCSTLYQHEPARLPRPVGMPLEQHLQHERHRLTDLTDRQHLVSSMVHRAARQAMAS